MKKTVWIMSSIIVVLLSVIIFMVFAGQKLRNGPAEIPKEISQEETQSQNQPQAQISNPASDNCIAKGGNLEIITQKDGNQFGMCYFEDYACEEWALFRNECDIEGDSQKITQALIDKGLDLTNMKVIIHKHMGKYIGGGVVPTTQNAGGGYVFAVKENGAIKILADGNGAIMCNQLVEYPDFPSYLIPECVDAVSGNPIAR